MARLYADEDFPTPVVQELIQLGYDVLTCQDDGRSNRGIPDPLVLARAAELNRTLLTHNHFDFGKLHRLDSNHEGIISCSRDRNPVALAHRIHEAISALNSLTSQFIRIVRPSARP